ncbi:hypothetical protein RND71_008287 [Anisodus tanguticus]|uniref:Uncharacterized protein n=1 Tax=Anisodus tanguticus TaxID=243964 RepID=A0AAE1SNU6_9SOLA|nr:hypothetical protein RND71_008287 [Anisodus tanguticus]
MELCESPIGKLRQLIEKETNYLSLIKERGPSDTKAFSKHKITKPAQNVGETRHSPLASQAFQENHQIVAPIGMPLALDRATISEAGPTYTVVRVEIDLKKPLLSEILVETKSEEGHLAINEGAPRSKDDVVTQKVRVKGMEKKDSINDFFHGVIRNEDGNWVEVRFESWI